MKFICLISGLTIVYGDRVTSYKRMVQETVGSGEVCSTMIPPSPLPPDDSTCWQWWTPPPDGKLPAGSPSPPRGCNYSPCERAVCNCDNYCCDIAWDLSCRGYYMSSADTLENNYFVPGCSAKLLCCEPESAYPDPPIGGASGVPSSSNQCVPGTPNCCPTMIPPSFLPPDDSSCWQWWDVPANGVVLPGVIPPKGCNYKPCQDAVCACDPYCCSSAWDLSCRGYHVHSGDNVDNNYFVEGCSAKMLCCEPDNAYPDPPVSGGKTPKSEIGLKVTTKGNIVPNTYNPPVPSPVFVPPPVLPATNTHISQVDLTVNAIKETTIATKTTTQQQQQIILVGASSGKGKAGKKR